MQLSTAEILLSYFNECSVSIAISYRILSAAFQKGRYSSQLIVCLPKYVRHPIVTLNTNVIMKLVIIGCG